MGFFICFLEERMKISALFSILFLCFVLVSCGDDEEELSCATVMDCPGGYACVNSFCQPQSGETGEKSDTDDSGNGGLPGNDSDMDSDVSEEVQGCPNACSGFGECDVETRICTCTQNHAGEDCSECAEGYHLESEELDEDGDPNIRSCVYNKTCDPNPCNGGKCTAMESTVKCECVNHAAGTLCEECEEGYLKSAVNGECKPDCSGTHCEGEQKCGIDFTTNEATCNTCSNEFYSGADCKSCDVAHFCGDHATACIVENSTEKCTCETGYTLTNNKCIKECKPDKCFKTRQCEGESSWGVGTVTGSATAHGTCSPTTGECICDAGWVTGTSDYGVGTSVDCMSLGSLIETYHNVECAECDVNNPPSQYASTGCPAECPIMFCNNAILISTFSGSCYYEPTGSHRLYCKCESGYTMSGSKYYDENQRGMCGSESSE